MQWSRLVRLLMVAALGLVVTVITPRNGLAFQSQTAVVKIQPSSLVLGEAGGNFSVEVVVENTSDLGAFEFEVLFDPMVILFVDVQVEPFLGSTGRDVICEPPMLTERTVRFGCHTGGPISTGPSGSGPLARLTFSAHGAGVSPLALVRCELSTILGDPVPANCKCGSVDVREAPPPGVGGTVMLPPGAVAAESDAPMDDPDRRSHVNAALVVIVGAVVISVGGWYARRRWPSGS